MTKQPKSWKDRLDIIASRGVFGVTWVVWDEFDGEIEGAVVGESLTDIDSDAEYTAVHNAVYAFWKSNLERAYWIKGGFWFENESNARKALAIGRKALAELRKKGAQG